MGDGIQYAVTYRGLDGQCVVYDIGYLKTQIEDALQRCQKAHPDCGSRIIRADLIGVE